MHIPIRNVDDLAAEAVRQVLKAILGLPYRHRQDHPPLDDIRDESFDVVVDMELAQPGITR